MRAILSGLFIRGDNKWVVLANKTISVSLNYFHKMFFKIVMAMYINNKICVKINYCERTGFLKSNVGVLHGDSLSPLLFLDSTFHALYYYISMFMIGLAHRFMHAR